MKQYSTLLASRLSQGNETLTAKQLNCVNLAIVDCTVAVLENYRSNEAKAINKEIIGFLPMLIKGEFTLIIRNWCRKRAQKSAQLMSDTQNMKIYGIRSGNVSYKLLSTADVDHNKKLRILGKNVGAKELTATADFYTTPKERVRIQRVFHTNK